MRYLNWNITFQEVPNEISLSFSITGCPVRCKGCHSIELWNIKNGAPLSDELFLSLIERYYGQITTVLFLGGEWHESELIHFLRLAKSKGLKTCLYSGLTEVCSTIKSHLDFLKVGPWIEAKGGLKNPRTNQTFIEVKTNRVLNELFQDN